MSTRNQHNPSGISNLSNQVIVQLVQVNQYNLQQEYLPYVAGLLQAYAQRHARQPNRYLFLPFLFRREDPSVLAEQAQWAQIVAFSCYVWNIQYSLALARLLKSSDPQRLTVFGGPQIPDRAEAFLRQHPEVDVVVHGEGEPTFLDLLESWPDKHWDNIAGISWLDAAGNFHHTPRRPRLRDLDEIPSPYLMGIFAPLLQERPGQNWIGLWETNRGCPFSCAFCDWGSATASKVNRFGMERLLGEVEWFGKNKVHNIYCCDANFGLLPRDVELADAMVSANQRYRAPSIFYTQSTKNVTDRAYEIQRKVSQAGMNQALTLSLQSVTPAVLEAIQRQNISLETYRELQQRFRADGVQTYTDMLVGLPGETYQSFRAAVNQIITEGQHNLVRFYNVYVLPNAPMAQPEYRQKHALETVVTPYAEPLSEVDTPVTEYQEMVIASKTLSREDWIQCRSLAWWAELIYYNRKILQLPLILMHELAGFSYGELLEHYLQGELPPTEIVTQIRAFMLNKARAVQNGESELCPIHLPQRGEIWMAVEDYLYTGLGRTQAWPAFFQDQTQILKALLVRRRQVQHWPVIEEALQLSALLLQGVLRERSFVFDAQSNFWEVYQGVLLGRETPLQAKPQRLVRDWSGPPYHHLRIQPVTKGQTSPP